MPCPECDAKQRAIASAVMGVLEIFWHYGQIIPLEDRKKLGELVGELVIAPDTERVRNEIVDLLAGHEVQIVFKSKHKTIRFGGNFRNGEPICVSLEIDL